MQNALRESHSLCRNKLDGLTIRAEWLCVLSGKGPALSWSEYYHYFNIPCHLSGNVICIPAGVWHIFSAYYIVGEERLCVYRGSCAFSLDFFPSRFSTIAPLRRHPQLIASQNPPVLLWDCSGGAEWKSLERRNLPAEVSLAWKRASLCAGASLMCYGGFPLSCGPRRPE